MLTVEDGTGVATADSFISLADFRTFAEGAMFDAPADDVTAEGWLRRAAFSMGPMGWLGEQGGGALAWPRSGVVLRSGEVVAGDTIPRAIVYGQAMLALEQYAASQAAATPGGGAAVVEHSVKVDVIEETKKFDLASRNAGSLPEPAAVASSRAQFADYLRYRGLHIPAIRA